MELVKYEFTNDLKAHAFHAEAAQYGAASMDYVVGFYPETWNVYVSPEFDSIVEARGAA